MPAGAGKAPTTSITPRGVTNTAAATTGRELWGFHKQTAQRDGPSRPGQPAAYSIRSLHIPEFRATQRGQEPRLVESLLGGALPMVFLKQSGDAQHAHRCDGRALVEASAVLERFHRGGLLGPHAARIEFAESHPIGSDLGLPGPIFRASACNWTEFDFTMCAGTYVAGMD